MCELYHSIGQLATGGDSIAVIDDIGQVGSSDKELLCSLSDGDTIFFKKILIKHSRVILIALSFIVKEILTEIKLDIMFRGV